ncbi:MAG: OmpA family protein [Candidatus Kapabacteria bacterium]|nr:OmpA family protein [Candidatus Kapabacteria bacterium]
MKKIKLMKSINNKLSEIVRTIQFIGMKGSNLSKITNWEIICLLIFISFPNSIFSQQLTPEPNFFIGGYGGGNYNIHNAAFKELPGYPSCCPKFETGNGLGFTLAGLLRYPINEKYSVSVRIGYQTLNGKLEKVEQIGNTEIRNATPPYETQDIVKAYSNHIVDSKIGIIAIEPYFNWFFWDKFRLNIGLPIGFQLQSKFSMKEQLTSPDDVVFKDTDSRLRNVYNNQDIPETQTLQIFAKASLSYALPIGINKYLVPEVGIAYPFTNIFSGDWKVMPINFGVALELPIYPVIHKERIEREEYYRDTIIIAQYGLAESRVYLQKEEIKEKSEEIDNRIITTKQHFENYIREVPKSAKITGNLDIVGIDYQGNRTKDPTLVIEENQVTESFPLLPYVFFKENSADLNQTAMKLDKNLDMFSMDSLTWETMEIYSNLLNIIATRLDKYSNAKIKITGTNSNTGFEQNNLTLSRERAEAVRKHFINNLGIPQNRIETAFQNLPTNPSNPTIPDGIEENQRAEISSNKFEITAPVELSQIEKTANPPIVEFIPHIQSDLPIKNWTMTISQNEKTIRSYEGTNITQIDKWTVGEAPIPLYESPINVKMILRDSLNNEFTIDKKLNISQKTIKKKREEIHNDTIYQRYSLIVFDFDKADLTPSHKKILDEIKRNIKSTSKITIYGYADRTGTPEYNKDLATRRIEETVKYLQLDPANVSKYPIGSDELIFDNNTPQGRSYSRTVRIIIATPVK